MTVDVVLDLRDVRTWRLIIRSLVCQWRLEPIGNFEYISRFQLFVISVPAILWINLPNSLQILPLEYLLIREQRRHTITHIVVDLIWIV